MCCRNVISLTYSLFGGDFSGERPMLNGTTDGMALYEKSAMTDDVDNYATTDDGGDFDGSEGSNGSDKVSDSELNKSEEMEEKLSEEKMVYSADVTLETLHFDDSYDNLVKVISNNDGFLQSENQSNDNSNWYYEPSQMERSSTLSFRVPSKNFKKIMKEFSDIGNVVAKNVNAENMTSEYIDVEARLESYQTEMEELQDLMKQADNVNDIMAIQSQISNLQYEIDSAKSRLSHIDMDVAYSTVSVTLREVSRYTTTPSSFFERIVEAFGGSIRFFINFLQWLIIFLIYAIPVAALVGFIIWLIKKGADKFKYSFFGRKSKKQVNKMTSMYHASPQNANEKPVEDNKPILTSKTDSEGDEGKN